MTDDTNAKRSQTRRFVKVFKVKDIGKVTVEIYIVEVGLIGILLGEIWQEEG